LGIYDLGLFGGLGGTAYSLCISNDPDDGQLFYPVGQIARATGIRNAFIYGLSIIAIYTIAGTAVAAIQGA